MKVRTNNIPRPVLSYWELTEKQQALVRDEFDWMVDEGESWDDCGYQFFIYKNDIYTLANFMRTDNWSGWHGYQHFTYDSGLVVKFPDDDYEQIIVGRY